MKFVFLLFLSCFVATSTTADETQSALFNQDMLMLDEESHFLTFKFLETAPLFVAPRLEGGAFRLNEYSGKVSENPRFKRSVNIHGIDPRKYVILSFYASYCDPCKIEVPELIRFYESISSTRDDVLLVFVGMDTERDKAENFFSDNNIVLPQGVEVLLNPPRNTFAPGRLYNVEKLPALFVINKDREIIFDQTGFKDGYPLEEAMRNIIVYYEQVVAELND